MAGAVCTAVQLGPSTLVIVAEHVVVQPFESVTTTLYVPAPKPVATAVV